MKLAGDTLIFSTEKILLEIGVQRQTCCHSAGSLTFGKDGNLYIAIGDNTSSKESDGYTPLDERVGRSAFDSQKSSANTHDLRGKILRIHPEKNATYTIPEGNLFPKDGSKGRPEIYAMGCRNPFRIATDIKNGWVFWGDVGPDAGAADTRGRGPESFDEYNLAKAAGNFGWPYFLGNNFAYRDFDFADSTLGNIFDPLHPENNSPNNYGAKLLPPAQPAWIWYSYKDMKELPLFGSGGRSAMAGPVYHYNMYNAFKNRFPKYYDDKVFIYEWMRDWIIAVTIDKTGKIKSMEKFMPNTTWSHPIDLEISAQGDMYMLEYGTTWFAKNDNARLIHIVYNAGNRAPQPHITISDSIGKHPLKVSFDGSASADLDKDKLTYLWNFGADNATSTEPKSTFVYSKPGIYYPKLTVADAKGDTSSVIAKVIVGNTYPKISLNIIGDNQSFYLGGESVNYKAIVTDVEDMDIQKEEIKVQLDFVETTQLPKVDPERLITDHALIAASDCKACHAANKNSVGPSFTAIAKRYASDKNAIDYLAQKIILGGSGNWSEQHAMSAHPQLSIEQTREMVKFILSYDGAKPEQISQQIPSEGSISPLKISLKKGIFTLTATYTDKGYQGKYRLTSKSKIALLPPKLRAENRDDARRTNKFLSQDKSGKDYIYQGGMIHNSYLMYKAIDLKTIKKINASVNSNQAKGVLEVRTDSENGDLIAQLPVKPTGKWEDWYISTAVIKPIEGKKDLFFIYKNIDPSKKDISGMMNIDWIEVSR